MGKKFSRKLGTHKRRREDNIKIYLKGTGGEDVDWIHLAQDTVRLCVLVKTVMNLWLVHRVGRLPDQLG
jgi:hypothetical protein